MQNNLKKFILFLCLSLYVIFMGINISNISICFDKFNQHIAINIAGTEICCDSSKTLLSHNENSEFNKSTLLQISQNDAGCDSCIDVLIKVKNMGQILTCPNKYIKDLLEAKTISTNINQVFNINLDLKPPNNIAMNNDSKLNALKTVMLLI